MSFSNGPIRYRAGAAGDEGAHRIRPTGDLMGIPALTKSMHKGGREGITGAHRVGDCDVVSGNPGEFAVFENRAAAFAEGDTHGL